jgi:hypothetical protein
MHTSSLLWLHRLEKEISYEKNKVYVKTHVKTNLTMGFDQMKSRQNVETRVFKILMGKNGLRTKYPKKYR